MNLKWDQSGHHSEHQSETKVKPKWTTCNSKWNQSEIKMTPMRNTQAINTSTASFWKQSKIKAVSKLAQGEINQSETEWNQCVIEVESKWVQSEIQVKSTPLPCTPPPPAIQQSIFSWLHEYHVCTYVCILPPDTSKDPMIWGLVMHDHLYCPPGEGKSTNLKWKAIDDGFLEVSDDEASE